ncbi:MAG: hypothetical protein JWO12_183 [Frankiales bacterium]|nr:hypothetical protein [Frankiales bacterium]
MTYTGVSLLVVAATVVLDLLVLRARVLAHKAFWPSYAIVLVFQLVTNGILTGRGIVHYAGGPGPGGQPPFLGAGRIAFAPYQDLLFGFALVVQTVSWWVFWGRLASPEPSDQQQRAEQQGTDDREDGA